MKITMDVECTPEEARKFFGLPDVQPLQATMMAELEKRMRAEMERFSPEGLLNTWLSATPNVEWMQGLFKSILDQASSRKEK